jgi:hypothetical protein
MTTPTLWIEITIAGAVYLAGIGFAILSILGVKDLGALTAAANPYMPYLAACAVAVSYIVGVVAHRMVQVLARPVLAPVEKLFHLPELTNRIPSELLTAKMVAIWQRGSSRLQREVDFQYALVALIRSLLFSVPLLGFAWALWLVVAAMPLGWLPAAAAAISWPVVFAAYRRQWNQFQNLRVAAWEAIDNAPVGTATETSPVVHNTSHTGLDSLKRLGSPPNTPLQPTSGAGLSS